MFFIVAHHLISSDIWGEITESVYYKALSVNITCAYLDSFFILGVNLFFLLSGWLKIRLRAKKIISLIAECYVIGIFSVCLAVAFKTTVYTSFSAAALEVLAFPFTHWFIPAYLLLCFLSPLLNALAENLKGKSAVYAVLALFVIFCIGGFIADYFYVNGLQSDGVQSKVSYLGTNGGYSVIWAAVCYLTGRIFSINSAQMRKSFTIWLIIFIVCCVVNATVLTVLLALKNGNAAKWYSYCYNNPLAFSASICFICAFSRLNVKQKGGRILAFISAHTFAVYIMHSDNPLLSPHRAYLIGLAGGRLWAQVLLLPINAAILFVIGVLVSVLYSCTIGRLINKINFDIKNKKQAHKE